MNYILLTLLVLDNKIESIKSKRESGQGSLEYVGMIAVAAIIIVLVAAVAKSQGPVIAAFITSAVAKVTGAVA